MWKLRKLPVYGNVNHPENSAISESSENPWGIIRLYRLKQFPLNWQFGLAASDYMYGIQRSALLQCIAYISWQGVGDLEPTPLTAKNILFSSNSPGFMRIVLAGDATGQRVVIKTEHKKGQVFFSFTYKFFKNSLQFLLPLHVSLSSIQYCTFHSSARYQIKFLCNYMTYVVLT